MKKSLIAAASAATFAFVSPALAQDAATNTGVYGNLNAAVFDGGSADVKGVQGRLGYRFNNYLGVEGELGAGLESDKDTILGVDVSQKVKHQAAAYAVGYLPLSPNTDLLARVGYGTTKLKAKALTTPPASASTSLESWNFGVGAQHYFDGQNGLRVDFTRQEFEDDAGHANVWTVGYTRRF